MTNSKSKKKHLQQKNPSLNLKEIHCQIQSI